MIFQIPLFAPVDDLLSSRFNSPKPAAFLERHSYKTARLTDFLKQILLARVKSSPTWPSFFKKFVCVCSFATHFDKLVGA